MTPEMIKAMDDSLAEILAMSDEELLAEANNPENEGIFYTLGQFSQWLEENYE